MANCCSTNYKENTKLRTITKDLKLTKGQTISSKFIRQFTTSVYDDYADFKELGSGAFGKVFRAKNIKNE